MDVGKKIVELRQKKGWSQYRLYKKADINQPTLSRIESGQVTPSLDILKKIATALEVSISEFDDEKFLYNIHSEGMRVAENMPKSEDEKAALEILKAMPEDEQRRRIFKEYESLSPEQQQAIDIIIRLLASSR